MCPWGNNKFVSVTIKNNIPSTFLSLEPGERVQISLVCKYFNTGLYTITTLKNIIEKMASFSKRKRGIFAIITQAYLKHFYLLGYISCFYSTSNFKFKLNHLHRAYILIEKKRIINFIPLNKYSNNMYIYSWQELLSIDN